MEKRILGQVRLAQLREISSDKWELAASLFLSHHPGFVQLLRVDTIEPKPRVTALPQGTRIDEFDTFAETHIQQLSGEVTSSGSLCAKTSTIKLRSGKPGYLIAVPSLSAGKAVGLLVGVADLQKTLDATLSHHAQLGYSLAVMQGPDELYEMEGSTSENRKNWLQVAKVSLKVVNWDVHVWPKSAMLAAGRSQLPELGAIFGLLLLLLLASTIHFAQMLRAKSADLEKAHGDLEHRVQERTAELHRTNDDLRSLSARVLHLQDEERRRIARELHDSTVQTLSALKMGISSLRKMAGSKETKSGTLLGQTSQLADQALIEVRSLSYLLHPPILEDFGLNSALPWYAEGFCRRSGIQVHVEVDRDLGRLSPDLELMLFRIVQEALSNIHRHSGSTTASIKLVRRSSEVALFVSDQGCGLPKEVTDPQPGSMPHIGVGIAGMRERVRQFGGKLRIASSDMGTTVSVLLPGVESRPVDEQGVATGAA